MSLKSTTWLFIGAAIAAFAVQIPSGANATTYNLTLTDPSNATYDGTGTLVIAGTPTASGTDQFCLSNGCGGGSLTSLSFSIDGGLYLFSTAGSGVSFPSATFTSGVLTALSFGQTVGGNDQLQIPFSGGLTYSFNQFSGPSVFTTGTITDSIAATPLPAALPLFIGGLGMIGLLSRRKKRNVQSDLGAA
jgi:hypothetical protein